MILLVYLCKTIIVSGILFGHYWLFLRNKQFHQYNRFYLLGVPVVALLLPLINIPVSGVIATQSIRLLKVIATHNWEEAVIISSRGSSFFRFMTVPYLLWTVYLLGAVFLLQSVVRSLWCILRLAGKYPYEKINGIRFYQTTEPGTPFSFLANIFWNNRIETSSELGAQIFRHELYHVRQKHTADILYMEFMRIGFWFNPFLHLIDRENRTIHEFLADQYGASGSSKHEYAQLLLLQSVKELRSSLANPFFNNQIKRRIKMITYFKKNRYSYLSRALALPVLILLFCGFAFRMKTNKTAPVPESERNLTVVIDAGHGGMDPGTISNMVLEKNLNLAIAKKIMAAAGAYHVHVVMTREGDILPGNASSIDEGLTNRIRIAESGKADLFISIHTDADADKQVNRSGFMVYVSGSNRKFQKSIQLGSVLVDEIKNSYAISPELMQRERHIRVLDIVSMPSVMIECGFLTNKEDLAFITNEKNQEKIAGDILKGIVRYANNQGDNRIPGPAFNMDTVPSTEWPKTFTKVEIEPEYPGGQAAWMNYLKANLHYPKSAVYNEKQGTVLTKFIVKTDSTLSDFSILKSPDSSLSTESLTVIRNSGKWAPAKQHGHLVNSYKIQPIVFTIEKQ